MRGRFGVGVGERDARATRSKVASSSGCAIFRPRSIRAIALPEEALLLTKQIVPPSRESAFFSNASV